MFGIGYKEVCRTTDAAHRQAVVDVLNRFSIPFQTVSSQSMYATSYAGMGGSGRAERTVFRVRKADFDRAVGALAECMMP